MPDSATPSNEREAALLMLQEKQKGNTQRITVGADKAYDTNDFVTAARALNVTVHAKRANLKVNELALTAKK